MISQLPEWNLVGFFDDDNNAGLHSKEGRILGKVDDVNDLPTITSLAIAISNSTVRQKIALSLHERFDLPCLIHPSANEGHADNYFGKGVIVTAGVIFTTNIHVGDFSIINLLSTIGHDSLLSMFTSIMPQCSISGNVKLGSRCFIGAGARILQGVSLGDDCIVGAGAVVTKSFSASSRLMGVPARQDDQTI